MFKAVSNQRTLWTVQKGCVFNFLRRSEMKAKLIALVAAPLMGISGLTFAQDSLPTGQSVPQEPIMLSQAEMDSVTAAGSLVTVGNVNAAVQVNVASWGNYNKAYQN
jgi:hypothetical protein